MQINGNLKFRTLGKGELQNAIIERLASAPIGEPGRIYFNTTDNFYYFFGAGSPAVWEKIAPGSIASNLLLAMGYVNVDGTFNASTFSTFAVIGSPISNLVDVLQALDSQFCPALLDFCTVGATTAADQFYYSTAAGTLALGTITAAGRALVDDADAATQRTTLGLVAGGAGDIWVEKAGDTMTGVLSMSTGTYITIPDLPANPTDATNKNYVDQIASSIRWREPVQDPDLVDIVSAEPVADVTAVGDTVTYIKWGGTQGEMWGVGSPGSVTNVVNGDILTYKLTDAGSPLAGTWVRIGTLVAGSRFIIAAEHGHIHSSLALLGFNNYDLIEYVDGGGSPGTNPYTAGAWTRPEGLANVGSPSPIDGSPNNEIPNGTTVLCSNSLSYHAGHSYSYDRISASWIEISGPGAVQAGTGLSYSGNILNVNLGAGIIESPADEVGIDLYDTVTGAIILTTDGTTRSTAANSQLQLLLTPSGGLVQDATGLSVDLALGGLNNVTDTGAAAGNVPVVSDGSPLAYTAQALQFNYDSTLHGGAATSHTITHNLGQQFVNPTVYLQDSSPLTYRQIIPQSVTLDSVNQLTVTFNKAINCVVVVMGVPGVGLA